MKLFFGSSKMGNQIPDTYLKLRWDGFFGWKRPYCRPLSPFIGTYENHPPVFCPPETKRQCDSVMTPWTVFPLFFCPPHNQRHPNTYVCLALAVQYFLFLSASLSWPFLQHWPHTNIIFRFGGPNLRGAFGSCRSDSRDSLKSVTEYKFSLCNSDKELTTAYKPSATKCTLHNEELMTATFHKLNFNSRQKNEKKVHSEQTSGLTWAPCNEAVAFQNFFAS